MLGKVCCGDVWGVVGAVEDITVIPVTADWDDFCLCAMDCNDGITVVDVCAEAVISESFAANVCVVFVVTIFVALPAVIIALVYDIVVFVLVDEAN